MTVDSCGCRDRQARLPSRTGQVASIGRAGAQPVTTSAALSAGTVTVTFREPTGTGVGAGLNAPLALTGEPAIVTALADSDGAVSTYSLAVLAVPARLIVALIAALPSLLTNTLFPT